MTTKELLTHLYSEGLSSISGGLLETIQDRLLECDEFKNVTNIEVIDHGRYNYDGKPKSVGTRKFSDGETLSGTVYLKSISLGAAQFDPKTSFYTAVKDGCSITPITYNPETFEPRRKIMITTEISDIYEESRRERLHDLLDDILDNPSEYTQKGDRALLISGVFEKINSPTDDRNYEIDISKVSFDVNEFNAYYRAKFPTGATVLDCKWLPMSLKTAYETYVTDNGIPDEAGLESLLGGNPQTNVRV